LATLAHESGVAMRYVASVERGEENPSLKLPVKIAEALEAEPAIRSARSQILDAARRKG